MDNNNNEEDQQSNTAKEESEEENEDNKPPTRGEIAVTIAVGVIGLALGFQALKLSGKAFKLGGKILLLGGALSSQLLDLALSPFNRGKPTRSPSPSSRPSRGFNDADEDDMEDDDLD